MQKLAIITVILAAAAVFLTGCGDTPAEDRLPDDLRALLKVDTLGNPWDAHLDSAPDGGCTRMRIRGIGSFGKVFNDSNHVHLSAAALTGIRPLTDSRSAWDNGHELVEVKSCREYFVDNLTHSYPYLSRTGANLLHEIGRRFNDSLQARGGGDYRMKVTSVLRTPLTVGKLRRVNRNATTESAHSYGATFDISYSKFICDSDTGVRRSFEDLKNLLAEIIRDLRDEGRCYVKHERRQACFHITARPDAILSKNDPDNETSD